MAQTSNALVRAEGMKLDAEITRKANELGKEVLTILEKGVDISGGDAVRLLRLWVLRGVLLQDEQVAKIGRSLKEIRDLLSSVPKEGLDSTEVEF